MRFSDIPAKFITIRIKRTDGATEQLPAQPVLSVELCTTRPGEFELRLKDSVVTVRPVLDADVRRLSTEIATGRANLAQLVNPAADGSIELQMAFFAGECLNIGVVEVGVDEYVERRYAKIFSTKLSGKYLYEELSKRCCYDHGGQPHFFFFAGPAIDSALRPEDEEEKDSDAEDNEAANEVEGSSSDALDPVRELPPEPTEPTRSNSLCIMGDGIRFIATETVRPDGKSIYIVTRLTKVMVEPDRALRLARGRLTFSDWTQAGQIQMLTKAQMSAITHDEGSYLKRWDEFTEVEGELVLAQARKIGTLQYGDMTPNRDGTVTVSITQASDSALEALARNEVESLEITDDLPEYLNNPEFTFAEFIGAIEKEAENETIIGKHGNQQKKTALRYDIADYDDRARKLTLKTENLPASGTLILSLAGHIAQIKRRLFARKSILEGRAANPQLGLLIEEKGKIAPTRPSSKITPLTAFVCDKIFRNLPTERQREAIEAALNTPDIALIQGPPGTGKTTVIAAIIERLNEEAKKRGDTIKGSVLLTGLQHDAVENMIERISLNGLPVPKFGRRSGSEADDFTAFERKLQQWCTDIATELRSKNPQLAEVEQETQIKNLYLQYLRAPTRTLALNIANRIAKIGIPILGEECSRRVAYLAKKLTREEQLNPESDPLLKAVRRLRHRAEAFLDDGPERASEVLDDLNDILEEDERKLLDEASLWGKEDGIPPFLKEIAGLKKKLLYRLTAPPVFRIEKQNDEIIALVEEAIRRIRTKGWLAKDRRSAALAEFLAELESNPYGMMDAVSDYAYAFAATCQQSVNKLMQRQKGIYVNNPAQEFRKLEYEYVIVDEAARVTPPDLMVAMAQGKKIILVGDHRQLPHIIDEAVAHEMESGEKGLKETEWLKKSMFEYLFSERLKALEEADGIRRRVTLDKQYRMHPLLGEFVSRNFYERFDPLEKFGSGRPAEDFAHSLPYSEGKAALWLDVPATKGRYMREGTSWIRRAEATAIVLQLNVWINSQEGQELSFGVISFYKAQAELIRRQLGSFNNEHSRLRVGTVDSFQGMEFDVVILSMVRTMRNDWRKHSDDKEVQARRLFGHLCLYNRLNVAMSRQKKLLVVAGDSGLLSSKLAPEYIPGLVNFYQLCQTHGRILPCH